ncbi:hypothetical protein A2572_01185 [Candidatus Collierbacteria bacterium RIFOXYD1_FULL_40_9]|uniref:LysM domain-containing protein n=1 Tax=Candidatus Collierbacteria bacterium RIFOXYD1_FULL_40_9 TaxID=1817731 RepID=A0A1F5FP65_9BACT|nr:MAG: hypothetical protein A2572_01185 [Candidatus Collierbacteria bacterium RIFOXYD1_FULL_40_9]
MNKGQSGEKNLKNILKTFKMNEDKFSTLLGIVVVFLMGVMIVNYFKSAKLNIWKGGLLDNGATTTMSEEKNDSSDNEVDTYKVVKGDDLWHIAEKHYESGYNYVDIIRENKLPANGKIEPGMELKLPRVEAKKITIKMNKTEKNAGEKVVVAVTPTPTKTAGTIDLDTYITQKGDSLWTISVRAYGDGFKWTKIYWENKEVIGKNPNILYTGVKLSLPKNM